MPMLVCQCLCVSRGGEELGRVSICREAVVSDVMDCVFCVERVPVTSDLLVVDLSPPRQVH